MRTRELGRFVVMTLALVVLLVFPAGAQVPTRVPFQGLLLDTGGQPLNTSVDLDFELFDALTAGTSLWSETHLGVIVVDGVYAVELGETSALTPAVVSGGVAFLEITVGGETLVPRQQLLSVPYALSAESVGGVSANFYEEVFRNFEFDGGEPSNLHPDEGLADSDGDGLANFVDPDNDNDGVLDAVEFAAGDSINLVTPSIASVDPTPVETYASRTLTVTGTNLSTLSSVSWGAETPVPYGLSSTQFSVDVVSETVAGSQDLVVTLANGENDSLAVSLVPVPLTISQISPELIPDGLPSTLTITGSEYHPAMTADIDGVTYVPTSVTPTEMVVDLPALPVGVAAVAVAHPAGTLSNPATLVIGANARHVFASSAATGGNLGGIAAADAICAAEAVAAGLPPANYLAWLSDASTSPSARFNRNFGPYILPSGTLVADDYADLTDGSLSHEIDERADGSGALLLSRAWTGTQIDGTPTTDGRCLDWTSASSGEVGGIGLTTVPSSSWTESQAFPTVNCSTQAHFYCFGN